MTTTYVKICLSCCKRVFVALLVQTLLCASPSILRGCRPGDVENLKSYINEKLCPADVADPSPARQLHLQRSRQGWADIPCLKSSVKLVKEKQILTKCQ